MTAGTPPVRYWDEVDSAPRSELASMQLERLNALLDRVLAANDFHAGRLRAAGVLRGDLRSLEELQGLPEMGKQDVLASMSRRPPFGDFLGVPESDVREIVSSSGTTGGVRETFALTAEDFSRAVDVVARDQRWKGGSPGDRAMYTVNLGITTGPTLIIAGWQRAGLVPLRAGPYTTEERVELFTRFRPTVIQLSRTYAMRFIDACRSVGVDPRRDVPNLEVVRTTGAAYNQSFVDEVEDFFGASLHETYGSTQSVHPTAGTCEMVHGRKLADRVLHLHEHNLVVEVVDPGTREPVESGEVGEVLLTTIGRVASPLIRYATRDLVRLVDEPCQCGRNFRSVAAGTIARTDDMLRIKNTNIWLADLEQSVLKHEWVREFTLELSMEQGGRERALLLVESRDGEAADPARADQLQSALREAHHVGFDIQLVGPGAIVHDPLKSRRCIDRR